MGRAAIIKSDHHLLIDLRFVSAVESSNWSGRRRRGSREGK